ncbi:unnamed protein product [Fraxinus pennsylvanica]|uniref:PGG domain-containing protein n=1 Tax=Fraxinus pennsylvanica TaxID=56036 RepID=A0AAD2A3X1_9LAMI|nr:unnamed protein product [Fraxinus pennsylvanica]
MQGIEKGETALLVAAKNGVVEMVEKIIKLFPEAINDMNTSKKNVVLLAVENRQPHVYRFLLEKITIKEDIFRKTARDIFSESHKGLIQSGDKWLTSTSKSWSIVAALIATVAFSTSITFPGGFKEEINKPTFANEPAFNIFTIASFLALCFSVTSVVMFLAILTSRYQEEDFRKDLPIKLLVGLTTLFVSIASTMVSFCSSHYFVLTDDLKHFAFPAYAFTCLLVTFFTMAQFPYYFDLIWSYFTKMPQPSY